MEQGIRSTLEVALADYPKKGLARAQAETEEQNYQLVYDAYLVGEVSLLDLLDAQRESFSANASATTAFYTFLSDLLSAQQAVGYFPFLEPRDEVESWIRELEHKIQERSPAGASDERRNPRV
jgi:outer membrane protein TolC